MTEVLQFLKCWFSVFSTGSRFSLQKHSRAAPRLINLNTYIRQKLGDGTFFCYCIESNKVIKSFQNFWILSLMNCLLKSLWKCPKQLKVENVIAVTKLFWAAPRSFFISVKPHNLKNHHLLRPVPAFSIPHRWERQKNCVAFLRITRTRNLKTMSSPVSSAVWVGDDPWFPLLA